MSDEKVTHGGTIKNIEHGVDYGLARVEKAGKGWLHGKHWAFWGFVVGVVVGFLLPR